MGGRQLPEFPRLGKNSGLRPNAMQLINARLRSNSLIISSPAFCFKTKQNREQTSGIVLTHRETRKHYTPSEDAIGQFTPPCMLIRTDLS